MKFRLYLLALAGLLTFQACDDDNDGPSTTDQENDAIANYADIAYASYDDSYKAAVALQEKINAFVAAPSGPALQQAKDAWLVARTPYGQTEVFRFYDGPIEEVEGLINAWPIDEAYIDYVATDADAGIINHPDEYPTISKDVLAGLNEEGSETNISTGYHAIEFLLWGQDQSTTGPGNRPHTDYVTTGTGTADNQARRGQYLKAVTDLLVENLKQVRDAWAEGAAYRETFEDETQTAATLTKIFTGMGELSKGELANERMRVAVELQDQENEHSCFSDNTINDIKMNYRGVRNIYYGEYSRTDGSGIVISGKSLKEIAQDVDATTAAKVEARFNEAKQLIDDIPAPFDQAILSEASADKIIDAADKLGELSDQLADLALKLGVKL